MKKNYTFKVKLNEETAKKLAIVSEKEGLTIQNMLVQLIRQKTQYFERAKSGISRDDLSKQSLDMFEVEEY